MLTRSIKKFFTSNQLSQILEETNPLSEISHKRKISCFGIGALDRKNTGINIREINSSHFGRICPIETSEGKNAGLILSLAQNAKLNQYGFIQAPFFIRLIITNTKFVSKNKLLKIKIILITTSNSITEI